MKRLLIVGSGLTGCCLSHLVARSCRPELLEIALWDKARGVGGRMSTTRSNKVNGCQVDLGAQYFSATPQYKEEHHELYAMLFEERLLAPLEMSVDNQPEYPQGTKHYVASRGSSSIPHFFLEKSGVPVNLRRQVSQIDLNKDTNTWTVASQDGERTEAHALVLTMPVPQILALKGNFGDLISSEVRTKLTNVQYSARYALGLFYSPGTKLPGEWTSKYIPNNPCLRFISKDSQKRSQMSEPPSLGVHTSAPFSLQHLDVNTSDVQGRIIKEMSAAFPEIPPPDEMKFHKWRYSQVYRCYDGKPGAIVIHSDPPLILAGDGFAHSNINGVFTSAKTTFSTLQSLVPDAFA